jgi:hypothetical protein
MIMGALKIEYLSHMPWKKEEANSCLVGAAVCLATLFVHVNLHYLLGAAASHSAAIVVPPLVRDSLQLLRAILAPPARLANC